MTKRILTISIALALCSLTSYGQFGGLVNKAKNQVQNNSNSNSNNNSNSNSNSSSNSGSSSSSSNSSGTTSGSSKTNKSSSSGSSTTQTKAALGPDEGITGPVHKKYLDQIVFAKERIVRETMNTEPDKFKKKFTLGESIYARVFLSKPFASFPATNGYFHVTLEVDGKNPFPDRFCYYPEGHPAPKTDNKLITTFQFSVIPSADDKIEHVNQTVVEVFNKLTPGDHEVKATVWTNFHGVPNPTVIMTGTFTLTVPAGGAKIKGISFETLQAGMTDPALSAQILAVVKKYATTNNWKETHTKVKIMSEEWYTERNDLTGRILGRNLSAWVYATWPDGHCTYQVFGVRQNYDGVSYSKVLQYNGVGDQTKCDCIK